MFTLADAALEDAEAIAALCAQKSEFYGNTAYGMPFARAAQVRAVLFENKPMANVLLAWEDDRLAGLAAYSFLWPATDLTGSLYLKELYVAAEYRRRGVGKLLMDGIYRIAAERRCSRVEWTADEDSLSAQAFYEALGAKPLASKIFYRVGGSSLPDLDAQPD